MDKNLEGEICVALTIINWINGYIRIYFLTYLQFHICVNFNEGSRLFTSLQFHVIASFLYLKQRWLEDTSELRLDQRLGILARSLPSGCWLNICLLFCFVGFPLTTSSWTWQWPIFYTLHFWYQSLSRHTVLPTHKAWLAEFYVHS